MEFEWDERKARPNLRKHVGSFQDAATIFGDPFAITFPDPDHSEAEERSVTFGLSQSQQLLVVAHTTRGVRTRIISARLMTRKEKVIYAEG